MSKVIGVTMVRNEADIIEASMRHALVQMDGIVVLDNGSTDGTFGILQDLIGEVGLPRMSLLTAPDRAYLQSERMSMLARLAAQDHDASWIVPFDADEFWLAPNWRDGQTVADRLRELDANPGVGGASPIPVVKVPIINHYCTALDPGRRDPAGLFRFVPQYMPWRVAAPLPLHKVAFRWSADAVIEQGNHGVALPNDPSRDPITPFDAGITIRHYPYRSVEHMTAKAIQGAEAYRAAGDRVPADAGAHWRAWGELMDTFGDYVMGDVFREHYWYLSPVDAGLINDPLSITLPDA